MVERTVRVRDFGLMQRHGEQKEVLRRLLDQNFHPGAAASVDLDGLDGVIEALGRVLRGERVSVVSARGAALDAEAGVGHEVFTVVKKGAPPPIARPGRGRGWVPKPEVVETVEGGDGEPA